MTTPIRVPHPEMITKTEKSPGTNESFPEAKENCADGRMIHVALRFLKLGYRPIPLIAGSKRAAVKWKRFQSESPTEEEIERWFCSSEANIALVMGNGVAVVDIDDPSVVAEVLARCGQTPMKCRTPRQGVHAYYRMRRGVHYGNSVKINDRPIDLRCEGAYVCVPWSRNENGVYEWIGPVLPPSDLPVLRVSWLRERKPKAVCSLGEANETSDLLIRRARGYLSRIEGAVAGHRGHAKTFRVACVLMQRFGLTFEQAWPIMLAYNERCVPEWSEAELRHKLEDAAKLRHGGSPCAIGPSPAVFFTIARAQRSNP